MGPEKMRLINGQLWLVDTKKLLLIKNLKKPLIIGHCFLAPNSFYLFFLVDGSLDVHLFIVNRRYLDCLLPKPRFLPQSLPSLVSDVRPMQHDSFN